MEIRRYTYYSKTHTSLTTSYYPTVDKPIVRKPFRFLTHKRIDVKHKFTHLYAIRENKSNSNYKRLSCSYDIIHQKLVQSF